MYFDLSVSIPSPTFSKISSNASKKNKGGKNAQPPEPPSASFTPGQITAFEARVDLLVHLGYTVLALSQVVYKRVDPKTHVNVLDILISQLRKREGIAYLKRLTIVLDEDSEKGFGLTTANQALFAPYDLLALIPTTSTTFSLACLSHSQPSPLTCHIISLPITLTRLPYHMKHTLVRSALKNGCMFEIAYAGALGEPVDLDGSGAEGGGSTKRNWWAGAREVVRVTKGKGIVVAGGVGVDVNLRAPRDVGNLMTLSGLSQDAAHDTMGKNCKTIVLRAQTRRTYRAILSEPVIVFPETIAAAAETTASTAGGAEEATKLPDGASSTLEEAPPAISAASQVPSAAASQGPAIPDPISRPDSAAGSTASHPKKGALEEDTAPTASGSKQATPSAHGAGVAEPMSRSDSATGSTTSNPRKRILEEDPAPTASGSAQVLPATKTAGGGESKNKKRKKLKHNQQANKP